MTLTYKQFLVNEEMVDEFLGFGGQKNKVGEKIDKKIDDNWDKAIFDGSRIYAKFNHTDELIPLLSSNSGIVKNCLTLKGDANTENDSSIDLSTMKQVLGNKKFSKLDGIFINMEQVATSTSSIKDAIAQDRIAFKSNDKSIKKYRKDEVGILGKDEYLEKLIYKVVDVEVATRKLQPAPDLEHPEGSKEQQLQQKQSNDEEKQSQTEKSRQSKQKASQQKQQTSSNENAKYEFDDETLDYIGSEFASQVVKWVKGKNFEGLSDQKLNSQKTKLKKFFIALAKNSDAWKTVNKNSLQEAYVEGTIFDLVFILNSYTIETQNNKQEQHKKSYWS